MESNMKIKDIMKLLHSLSVASKLEIISRLTEDIKTNLPVSKENKSQLLNELYGSWKDIEDDVIENIISSRTISDRDITLEVDLII
jgi:hypothetical protein